MAKQRIRHLEWQPPGLVHRVKRCVEKEQREGNADEAVFDRLPGGRTEQEIREAVEALENGSQSDAASPDQISQAASACNCNIETPFKVLAPSEEAVRKSAVSSGL